MDYIGIELDKIILTYTMIINMPKNQIEAFEIYRSNCNRLLPKEKVIIRSDLKIGNHYGNNGFVVGMEHGEHTIKSVNGNQFVIDDGGFYQYTIAMVDWIAMINNNGFNNKCNNELISWLI